MLGELVPLYHAMARLGLSPADVDRMEIWQAASILEYSPAPAPGTSYGAGGVDPYLLARAKAGEGLQIGRQTVPPRRPRAVEANDDTTGGAGPLRFKPAAYTPRGEVDS